MKALIFPAIIILALIAFFVVIDRREFNHYNDVRTEQSTSVEKQKMPTSFTGTGTKPVVDEKPVAAAKPIDPNAPMAVPVVTPEEAARLNAEALKRF